MFSNSGLTIEDIEKEFQSKEDLINADPKHYFNAALDWSAANHEMKSDWLATVRNFVRRDLKDGKLVMKKSGTQIQF